jgi:hypothetical protein
MVAAPASAKVDRNQTSTVTSTVLSGGTLTVNLPTIGNLVHTFEIQINPDGTFTGTGSSIQNIPWPINETITRSLNKDELSFDANYGDSAKGYAGWEKFVGYHWGIAEAGPANTPLQAGDSLSSPRLRGELVAHERDLHRRDQHERIQKPRRLRLVAGWRQRERPLADREAGQQQFRQVTVPPSRREGPDSPGLFRFSGNSGADATERDRPVDLPIVGERVH